MLDWLKDILGEVYTDEIDEKISKEIGKGEWIPSDMSYQDWKDIYVDKKYTLDEWKKSHN